MSQLVPGRASLIYVTKDGNRKLCCMTHGGGEIAHAYFGTNVLPINVCVQCLTEESEVGKAAKASKDKFHCRGCNDEKDSLEALRLHETYCGFMNGTCEQPACRELYASVCEYCERPFCEAHLTCKLCKTCNECKPNFI